VRRKLIDQRPQDCRAIARDSVGIERWIVVDVQPRDGGGRRGAFGVDVLHATELETEFTRSRHPVYKDWSKDKVQDFQREIHGLIVLTGLKDVGIAIPLSVYKSVLTPERRKKYGETPDKICALLCMTSAGGYAWANKAIYKQAPSFIFEAGGTYAGLVMEIHEYLTTKSYYRDFYRLSTLTFAPKSKEFPQLQAADYLAFNISKRCSHVVAPEPPAGGPLETLPDGRKVRKTRYPLLALYSENGSNVMYAPTAEILERIWQMIEAEDDYDAIERQLSEAKTNKEG